MIEAFIALWVFSAIIVYGSTFAYFQHEYESIADEDYWIDVAFSIFCAMFGPIGLIGSAILGHFKHGFKWK